MQKPLEFWVALATGVLIVMLRNHERNFITRSMLGGISAGIGFSLTPDIAAMTGRSETLVVIVLSVFGYMAIDVATGLIQDRDFLKEIIRKRLEK